MARAWRHVKSLAWRAMIFVRQALTRVRRNAARRMVKAV